MTKKSGVLGAAAPKGGWKGGKPPFGFKKSPGVEQQRNFILKKSGGQVVAATYCEAN